MTSILIIFSMLILIGLASGYFSCKGWYFSLGINTFQYPTFDFGMSSCYEFDEEGNAIQVVRIGLLVIVLDFEFFIGQLD